MIISDALHLELTVNRRSYECTPSGQEKVVQGIYKLVGTRPSLKSTKVQRGSVLVEFTVSKRDALMLYILNHIERLYYLDVSSLSIEGLSDLSISEILNMHLKFEPCPPIDGEKESGEIVFTDLAAGYGIIERDRGGFMKFYLFQVDT